MSERVVFLASFPPIQSAIKITGGGDGMRIQLDVPESEMANAVGLLGWRQRVFKVTVELEDVKSKTISRTKAKRRKADGNSSVQ
jgi:hypothetical protein